MDASDFKSKPGSRLKKKNIFIAILAILVIVSASYYFTTGSLYKGYLHLEKESDNYYHLSNGDITKYKDNPAEITFAKDYKQGDKVDFIVLAEEIGSWGVGFLYFGNETLQYNRFKGVDTFRHTYDDTGIYNLKYALCNDGEFENYMFHEGPMSIGETLTVKEFSESPGVDQHILDMLEGTTPGCSILEFPIAVTKKEIKPYEEDGGEISLGIKNLPDNIMANTDFDVGISWSYGILDVVKELIIDYGEDGGIPHKISVGELGDNAGVETITLNYKEAGNYTLKVEACYENGSMCTTAKKQIEVKKEVIENKYLQQYMSIGPLSEEKITNKTTVQIKPKSDITIFADSSKVTLNGGEFKNNGYVIEANKTGTIYAKEAGTGMVEIRVSNGGKFILDVIENPNPYGSASGMLGLGDYTAKGIATKSPLAGGVEEYSAEGLFTSENEAANKKHGSLDSRDIDELVKENAAKTKTQKVAEEQDDQFVSMKKQKLDEIKAEAEAEAEKAAAKAAAEEAEEKEIDTPICTNGEFNEGKTSYCKNKDWVVCSEATAGETSKDYKWSCQGGVWTCSENATQGSGSGTEVCKSGDWIKCDVAHEGSKSSDEKWVCSEGSWTLDFSSLLQAKTLITQQKEVVAEEIIEKEEEIVVDEIVEEEVQLEAEEEIVAETELVEPIEIQLSDFKINPKGFFPHLVDTVISFKLSAIADVEIKISDKNGVVLASFQMDELEAGDNEIAWDGKDNKEKFVPGGTHEVKIIATDPTSQLIKDTASGKVTVLYGGEDFEGVGLNGQQGQVPSANNPLLAGLTKEQMLAIMAQSNINSGEIEGNTGPSVLIYAALPLLGLLVRRKL